MPEPVQMVALHRLGGNGRGRPECFITRETALDMIYAGQAEWGNHKQKYLTRTKLSAEMYKAAPSLKPNIRIMEQYCEGKPHAIAIINSYRSAA